MKSLKLRALQFSATEALTRAQMKNVLGGDIGCGCKGECLTDDDCPGKQTCDFVDCGTPGPSCKYPVCAGKI